MTATRAPARRLLPPARRFSDWMIGGGVLTAEMLLAVRAIRRRKQRG
jgi:hypothetical protein